MARTKAILGAGARLSDYLSASLLARVGLGQLVADSPEQYLTIASSLARDRDALGALRGGLRQRVAASPLASSAIITGDLEVAFRDMWRDWCSGGAR